MVLEKVKEVLAAHLRIDASEISEDSNIVEDLNADSLDIADILMELEEQFEIEISDEDALTLKTVGDVVNYISEKL